MLIFLSQTLIEQGLAGELTKPSKLTVAGSIPVRRSKESTSETGCFSFLEGQLKVLGAARYPLITRTPLFNCRYS